MGCDIGKLLQFVIGTVHFPNLLRQMLLGLLAFGNVGVRTEPAQNISLRIADGNGLRGEPAVVAISISEGKRVFPDLAALETFPDFGHDLLATVWMMYVLPTPACPLLQGSTRV